MQRLCWFVCTVIIGFLCKFGLSGDVPTSQISILQNLYDAAGGNNWLFNPNVESYGAIWDFSTIDGNVSNPCVSYWQGIYCTSSCSTSPICNITTISLEKFNLVGTLPSSIGELITLQQFDLYINSLTGTIPSSVASLTALTYLDISGNSLDGTLPTVLATLTNLQVMYLEYNQFHGTIPSIFGQMSSLLIFSMSSACLTGSLPAELGSLTNLLQLLVSGNNFQLTTIPSSIGLLASVTLIDLGENSFIGTIPTQLGQLTKLQKLLLSDNNFGDSPLPSALSLLSLLTYIHIAACSLSGTIPSSLLQISGLAVITLYSNSFTGTLPTVIGSLSGLQSLSLSYNQLHGSLPSRLGQISSLGFVSCRNNLFTGTGVIQSILQQPSLQILLISDNYFSGSMQLSNISSNAELIRIDSNLFTGSGLFESLCPDLGLVELIASNNAFSGTIPSCMTRWSQFVNMDISYNQFYGTLPSQFASLTALQLVVLSGNQFSGSLDKVFNSSSLGTLVVSDNEFIGPLPTAVFNSSNLKTFIASKNCFTGTISDALCSATSLQTLGISGMTAGANCVIRLPIIKSYRTVAVEGIIPPCLFAMPQLRQLYIDGNALKSKLGEIPTSSVLQNISLSHNRLSGTIPLSIQEHRGLEVLDLSYNRLLGTISAMSNYNLTDSHGSIVLKANHLSGETPPTFTYASFPIDILSGNVFACNSDSSLPHSDPKSGKYSCGSKLLYTTLYCCGGLFGVVLLFILWTIVNGRAVGLLAETVVVAGNYITWQPNIPNSTDKNSPGFLMNQISIVLGQHRWCCCFVTLLMVCACLPVILILKLMDHGRFSTLTHQYGWYPSLAFIEGRIPGIVILACWLSVLLLVMMYEHTFIDRKFAHLLKQEWAEVLTSSMNSIRESLGAFSAPAQSPAQNVSLKVPSKDQTQSKSTGLSTAIMLLVNVAISLMANSLYVYIVMTQSLIVQSMAVWLLVMYKIGWTYMIIVPWLRLIHGKFLLILSLMICNNIIIPMAATMAVDVSCFKSSLVPEDPISTSYTYSICESFSVADSSCLTTKLIDTTVTFSAPIIYNSQCFAAVLTNYVPIYVITYGFIGAAACLFHIVCSVIMSEGLAHKDERIIQLIHFCKSYSSFPLRYWLPLEGLEDLQEKDREQLISSDDSSSMDQSPSVDGAGGEFDSDVHAPIAKSFRRNFYRARFHAINCVLVLTLLLTFGLAYPPLGCLLLINIVLHTLAFQLSIYYHSKQIALLPQECFDMWRCVVMDEIRMLHKVIHGSRTAMYLFSSLFVSFAIIDTTLIPNASETWPMVGLMIVCTYLGTVVSKQLRVNEISVTDKVVELNDIRRRMSTALTENGSEFVHSMRLRTVSSVSGDSSPEVTKNNRKRTVSTSSNGKSSLFEVEMSAPTSPKGSRVTDKRERAVSSLSDDVLISPSSSSDHGSTDGDSMPVVVLNPLNTNHHQDRTVI